MSRRVEKAVNALHTVYSSGLAAQLRAVETESGMAVGSLKDPVKIVKYRAPLDNTSPLLQIYEEGFNFYDQRHDLVTVDCSIVLSWNGSTDLLANEVFMRRYVDAIMRVIFADYTLGGQAVQAVVTQGEAAKIEGDQSTTRHLYGIGVDVTVQ